MSINKRLLLALLAPLTALSACSHSKEIEEARAQLDLAEMTGDLDSTYLVLRRLAELGDEEAGAEIKSAAEAINLRKEMETALADHDHEKALIAAEKLYSKVPTYDKALQTIRESGQILYYLDSAVAHLGEFSSTFRGADNSEAKDGAKANEDWEITKTFGGIFEPLSAARDYVAKAEALDPLFSGSLNLNRRIEGAQSFFILQIADAASKAGSNVVTVAAHGHDDIMASFQLAIDRGVSVQEIWNELSPLLEEEYTKPLSARCAQMEGLIPLVAFYQGGDTQSFAEALGAYIGIIRPTYEALLTPTGSMLDFERDAREALKKYGAANRELTNTLPSDTSISQSREGLASIYFAFETHEDPAVERILRDHSDLFDK